MFDYLDVPAFVLRTAIFFENFTTYPLLSLFVNDMIQKAFWRGSEVSARTSLIINFMISFLPLMFAVFYPNIGTILSYAGAISGFFIIYVLPVFAYLRFEADKLKRVK